MDRLSSQGLTCYTQRDLIIYALGIGFGDGGGSVSSNSGSTSSGNDNGANSDGDNQEYDLRHVYENHDAFSPFPTFPLVLPFRAISLEYLKSAAAPGSTTTATTTTGFDKSIRNLNYFDMPPFPTPMMNDMNVVEFISHYLNMNSHELQEKGKGQNEGNKEQQQQRGGTSDTSTMKIKSILHLSEKYRLHQSIPNTINEQTYIKLETNVLSIQPKRIGIIVITETQYYIIDQKKNSNENEGVNVKTADLNSGVGGYNDNKNRTNSLLATSQSTTLYILKHNNNNGNKISLPPQLHSSSLSTKRVDIGNPKQWTKKIVSQYIKHNQPDIVQSGIQIQNNQALLYRLSGDTNSIHVLPVQTDTSSQPSPSVPLVDRPILHGLCTLGFATHIIMKYCQYSSSSPLQQHNKVIQQPEFQYVSCDFVKPVFVGDEIQVCIWMGQSNENDQQLVYKCDQYGTGGQSTSVNEDGDGHVCDREEEDKETIHLLFQVRRSHDGLVLVDNGIVEVKGKLPLFLQSKSLDVKGEGGKEKRKMVFSSKL